MAWYTEFRDFRNDTVGLQRMFLYAADTVPLFTPLILVALFLIVALGSFYSQTRLGGRGDFWSSFAIAGYVISVVAAVMTLVDGLIDLNTLVIVFAVTIIGTLLLFISKRR